MPINIPSLQKFIYPSLGILSVFQLPYQQFILLNQQYLQLITQPSDNQNIDQSSNTLNLASSIYIIGAFLGTALTARQLKFYSAKYLFILADVIYLIFSFLCFMLEKDNTLIICLFFLSRIALGISGGINLSLSVVYVQQMSSKINYQIFSKLIPLSLQLGYLFAIIFTINQNSNLAYFQIIYILPSSVSIIRILLFISICNKETPQYYAIINKSDDDSQNMLNLIYGNQLSSNDSLEQIKSSTTLMSDFSSEQLFSTKFITKFFKCVLLILILQFSGINILTNNCLISQDLNIILYCILITCGVMISQIFLTQCVDKKILIFAGQVILIFGLALLTYFQEAQIKNVGTYIFYTGYSLGLGTYIFQIVPIQIPDLGVFACFKVFWVFELVNLWILGLVTNKQFNPRQTLDSDFIQKSLCQLYFIFSTIGLFILILIIKEPKLKKDSEDNSPQKQPKGILQTPKKKLDSGTQIKEVNFLLE